MVGCSRLDGCRLRKQLVPLSLGCRLVARMAVGMLRLLPEAFGPLNTVTALLQTCGSASLTLLHQHMLVAADLTSARAPRTCLTSTQRCCLTAHNTEEQLLRTVFSFLGAALLHMLASTCLPWAPPAPGALPAGDVLPLDLPEAGLVAAGVLAAANDTSLEAGLGCRGGAH